MDGGEMRPTRADNEGGTKGPFGRNGQAGPKGINQKSVDGLTLKLLTIFVLLFAVALYLNTLSNNFVFDDIPNVVNNSWIRDISHIPDMFSSHLAGFDKGFSTNYYRPLVHLVFMFSYQIFGLNAWGFHLVNVLFHTGVCVLVFLLSSKLLKTSGVPPSAYPFLPPLIAAMLFAAHPIHTEAVAWVAGVMDLSFTFFYLLSFYLYLRTSEVDPSPRGAYLLSLASFFIATLCKEPALTLPLVLLAYDYSFRPKFP